MAYLALCLAAALFAAPALAAPPALTIDPPAPSFTTAEVSGSLDPQGRPTTYSFQYISDEAFDAHADAEESVRISATEGTFTLAFKGAETGPLPFDAAAAVVESALNNLASIGGGGATVSVSGGPGDKEGTTPYLIVFEGSLAETNVGEGILLDQSALAGGEAGTYTEVNPQGRAPGFEGASTAGEETTEASGPVSATLEGLSPDTTYHLRLHAENADGSADAVAPNFTTEAVAKPVVEIDDVSDFTATTAHLSGQINPGGTDPAFATSFYFECSPSCPGLEGSRTTEPTDASSREVTEDAKGLEPNTEYTVSLHASNTGGEEVATAASFTTLTAAPEAWAGTNTPESASSVLLRGAVNPRNSAISDCHFAYGPGFAQSAPCESEVPLQASQPVPVTAKLTGLDAGTVGQFKVIATGDAGSGESLEEPFATFQAPEPQESCENETRREEQHSSFLPDCRAYEMVSPPKKNGADIMASSARTRASVGGDAANFASLSGFADVKGTGISIEYISTRDGYPGTQGWSTHAIYPQVQPNTIGDVFGGRDTIYRGEFSSDLDRAILSANAQLTPDPMTADIQKLYLRKNLLTSGSQESELITSCPLCVETNTPLLDPSNLGRPNLADSTADLEQILFESGRNLTADAPIPPNFPASRCNQNPVRPFSGCKPRLYENDRGILRLVGRVPPPGQIHCDDSGSSPCQAAVASIAGRGATNGVYTYYTLSQDGTRAFFTVPVSNGESRGDLYMRLDHTTTVQLNAPERPDAGPPEPATFETVSADGRRAFFSTSQQLTEDPCPAGLYAYDTKLPASDPHNLSCIIEDKEGSDGIASGASVWDASADGRYIYFETANALLHGQPSPRIGLYEWHDGVIRFVGDFEGPGNTAGNSFALVAKKSRLTPDGMTLLFTATASPTGYDHGGTCGLSGETACQELYLYRAGTGSVVCVSCNPSGAAASADASIAVRFAAGGSGSTYHLSHALTDDGAKVFFESAERLVPDDTNGVGDVYSYDAGDGGVSLISPGNTSAASYFLDATPTGSNVFFATSERLLSWDTDGNLDLYDARSGGGFSEPTPVPAPCQGDGCRSISSPPVSDLPASQKFANQEGPPTPCPRNKVRRRGKCVRRPKRRTTRHGRAPQHKRIDPARGVAGH